MSSKMITIEINNNSYQAAEDQTIFEIAKSNGLYIPHLCYHKDLLPYGACRLCMVEIEVKGRSRLVASCGYYPTEGLKVKTDSPGVHNVRKKLTELFFAIIPENETIKKLSIEYQINESRYKRNDTYCIHCNLCVRYCNEVKGKNAIGSVGRGHEREIAWIPLTTYKSECEECNECIDLCPTGVFPSNWGIVGVEE